MSIAEHEITKYLTPPQVAKMLGVNPQKILAVIARGELKATNLGFGIRPQWKISPADVNAFLTNRSNQQQQPTRRRRVTTEQAKRDWV